MRHNHRIAKHLYLKRAGLGELSFPSRPVPTDLMASPTNSSVSDRLRTPDTALTTAQDHWDEPSFGLALRKPADKQAKTARGHTFFKGNGVYHESELEHRVSSVLQTLFELRELQSQYPKVHYIDADGVQREHTFDYFIVLNDGTRVAVAVKYARKRVEMRSA